MYKLLKLIYNYWIKIIQIIKQLLNKNIQNWCLKTKKKSSKSYKMYIFKLNYKIICFFLLKYNKVCKAAIYVSI